MYKISFTAEKRGSDESLGLSSIILISWLRIHHFEGERSDVQEKREGGIVDGTTLRIVPMFIKIANPGMV